MDAALKAALAGDATVFTAVRIDMPEFTLRLVSGGAVTIDGVAFPSWNDIYGSLISADPVSDGMDDQTTRASILLAPPTDQGLADLAAPMAQGSPVWLWKGAVDGNGACIGSPELLFQGELDFGRLRVDDSGWMLTIECGTEEERQLEPNDERRLSHAFHQSVWPGEMGLEFNTVVNRKVYWRAKEPALATGKGGTSNSGIGGLINAAAQRLS